MGLNLLTREEEIGKVNTSNKVFESFKHFFMGPNSQGKIAAYIVSCDPIADVTAPDGSKILDFAMPYSANGLSGLGRNPVLPTPFVVAIKFAPAPNATARRRRWDWGPATTPWLVTTPT